MGSVRLLPLLAVAALCLFVLKAAGLLTSGGYMLSGAPAASAQSADAGDAGEETEPAPEQGDDPEEPGEAAAARADEASDARPQDRTAQGDGPREAVQPSLGKNGENEVLMSLAERREELDERARELEHRENLLKAAEKRVEERIEKLKKINQDIEAKLEKRDEKHEAEYARMASLYEKMKPKEAARIFNRLEIEILTGLMKRMKARTLSPILAEMDPTVVERVTMELTDGNEKEGRARKQALPKIASEEPE